MPQIKRLADGAIINVTSDPKWVSGVWECGSERFADPSEAAYQAVVAYPSVTVPAFMLLFTSPERQGIRAKVADTGAPDHTLNDWWAILQDQRTVVVDLDSNSTWLALQYLEAAGFLGSGRAAIIRTGIPL